MENTYNTTEARELTIGEFSTAIDTIKLIAKDPGVAKAFRKVIKMEFNPELIQLIDDLHSDVEDYDEEMGRFLDDHIDKEYKDNVKRYGYGHPFTVNKLILDCRD